MTVCDIWGAAAEKGGGRKAAEAGAAKQTKAGRKAKQKGLKGRTKIRKDGGSESSQSEDREEKGFELKERKVYSASDQVKG